MDDIRDIIVHIRAFNATHLLDPDVDQLIITDINSMYDNISFRMVRRAYSTAIKLLPPQFLPPEMEDAFMEALSLIERHAVFEYGDTTRQILDSQIQGSISGSDSCSFVLRVREATCCKGIDAITKMLIRYKDDILIIPKHRVSNTAHFESAIISKIYPDFEFETETPATIATMCDIDISISVDGSLKCRMQQNSGKVRMYVLKSSNVRQSCAAIFITLCQRYIIINDTKEHFIESKRIVCNTLLSGEWLPADIRCCRHPKYEDRDALIDKYLANKQRKLRSYVRMDRVHLYEKDWWKTSIFDEESDDNEIFSKCYMTYQKTFYDDSEIRNIVRKAQDLLPDEIKRNFKLYLYYRYQASVSAYTRLS